MLILTKIINVITLIINFLNFIKMKKNIIASILVLLSLSSCIAVKKEIAEIPSGTYEIDKAHSSVIFRVDHLGLSKYTARFTKFDAKLEFDNENPSKSSIETTIKANSVKTDFPFVQRKDFDKFLAYNENWFNARKFPEISFQSKKITRTGPRKATITGDLTMLGVTKEIKLKAKFNKAYKVKPYVGKAALGFSASAKIKRSEWGFDTFVPSIGDEVEIIIETEFHKL